jgi:hypothetical protein
MGLDMYLDRCDRRAYGYRDMDIDKIKVDNPTLYEELKPFIVMRGQYSPWESFFTEVGYWRKANAIHKWFVDNVQDEVDDCGRYEVSKEQLEELLDVCVKVRDCSKLVKGWVKNGERFENGQWLPCMEEGEYIENPDIAKALLPTQDGFFFGGTNYDQWYLEDVVYTIDIITKALETTDFDREMITYCSSW